MNNEILKLRYVRLTRSCFSDHHTLGRVPFTPLLWLKGTDGHGSVQFRNMAAGETFMEHDRHMGYIFVLGEGIGPVLLARGPLAAVVGPGAA